jgi:hypothetical protein
MKYSTILIAAASLLWGSCLAEVEAGEQGEVAQPPAENRAGSWSFKAGVGVKHDSKVAVQELDASSGESDYAALLDLGVGYRYALTSRATLRADYALSHTRYADLTDFDLTIHRGSVETAYDFDVVEAGVAYHYVDARLDGDEFLVMRQTSPYAAKLFGSNLYLRGAYSYTDKRFDRNPARDARNDAISADAFVFFNAMKTYVVLGYKHSWEEAREAQLDYAGGQVSAQVNHKLAFAGRDLRLRSRVRYENRDYDDVTADIGRERGDDRYRFDVSVGVPIGGAFTVTAQYEYADNRSNLPSADFTQQMFSLRLDTSL